MYNSNCCAGKYILKKVIFNIVAVICGFAAILLIHVTMIDKEAVNALYGELIIRQRTGLGLVFGPSLTTGLSPFDGMFDKISVSLVIIVVPLIVSIMIASLAGLSEKNGTKTLWKIIAAVLQAFVPVAFIAFLVTSFFIPFNWFPLNGNTSLMGYMIPITALTLPLTGYLMSAALKNPSGRGFAGSFSLVAARAAFILPIYIIFTALADGSTAAPGVGAFLHMGIMQMDIPVIAAGFSVYMILICIIRIILEILAGTVGRGEPLLDEFGKADRKEAGGKVVMIIFLVLALAITAVCIISPYLERHDPLEMDLNVRGISPGQQGHVLGTDTLGRDLLARVTDAAQNTIWYVLAGLAIAFILGILIGMAGGRIRNGLSWVFQGITYIFGTGLFIVPTWFALEGVTKANSMAIFLIPGLCCFGGIAHCISSGLREGRILGVRKGLLKLPLLERGAALMAMTVTLSMYFGPNTPFNSYHAFITEGRIYLIEYSHYLYPIIAGMLLVCVYSLLSAGFASRKRFLPESDGR